ncbi:HBR430Wp [Eremothecium sinecaudum]|uniref:HBR430Wp n=1 Tax=Eremothecium sinecaudum TaxID=45286 RepID=A0A109UXG3_9SACH|nr:HBR430Wp [Eremothecium sinecaudum]AMD19331.1 HBR430Wp [Eremothecium sinecaudum]
MAEQITHKKGIRRLDRDKRELLKQYYQLQSSTHEPVSSGTAVTPPGDKQQEEHEEQDNYTEELAANVTKNSLKELLHAHNALLARETAANNSIKNTIYENYYDLVKVNTILGEMGECPIQEKLETLKANMDRISQVRTD